MAIAARGVGDLVVPAGLTALHVAAEDKLQKPLTGAYPGRGFYRNTLSVYRAHFFGHERSAQISFDFRMHFNPSHLTP
jgi:hypothetical protein